MVYKNLRDPNFEYNAGKLPEADFQSLSGQMEGEAAVLLAEIESLEAPLSKFRLAGKSPKGALV